MQAINIISAPVKKVTIIGPECTGKTDLSQYLAAHFKTDAIVEDEGFTHQGVEKIRLWLEKTNPSIALPSKYSTPQRTVTKLS